MTLLSVITATLNARHNIEQRLDDYKSILCCEEFEWIIQDSARSTDNLIQLNTPSNVHIRHAPDSGIYSALNNALKFATGTWILVLGSDDTLNVNEFYSLLYQLKSCSPNSLLLLNYQLTEDFKSKCISPSRFYRSSFYRGMPISHQCIVSPRDFFFYKSFNLTYRYAADMDWLLFFYLRSTNFVYISCNSFYISMSLGGLSGQFMLRDQICVEFINILKHNGYSFLERSYLYLSLFKTRLLRLFK